MTRKLNLGKGDVLVTDKMKAQEVSVDKSDNLLQQQQSGETADITKDVFRKMDEASEMCEPVEE